MLRVPRPRVESVRRFVAGRASAGDEAVIRAGPGLLALLEHPVAGHPTPLGAGYHARYNVPLGLSTSAALAMLEPATPAGSWWVGREAAVAWTGLPALDDTLRAEARLDALSERDALFSISARTEAGRALLSGQLLLARVTGEGPVGYPRDLGSPRAANLGDRARERRAAASGSPAGLRLLSAPAVLPLGRSAEVVVELAEGGDWQLTARTDPAGGLSVEGPGERAVSGARASLTLRADRPDAVNTGEPWTLELRAVSGRREETLTLRVAVPDPDVVRLVDPLDVEDATRPRLAAWTAPEPCAADLPRRMLRFPVRLLGRGIRVDPEHPADVTVALPGTLDPHAAAGVSVVQAGRVLASGPPPVTVTLVDGVAPIEVEVVLTPAGAREAEARFGAAAAPPLRERDEPIQPDLLRLRPPVAAGAAGTYRVSPDVVRLLMNPLAGGAEPLGRRVHPLQSLGVGASLTAAFGMAGEPAPAAPGRARAAALWIRWLAPADLDIDFEARGRVLETSGGAHTVRVDVFDAGRRRTSEAEVVIADAGADADATAQALLARRRVERTPAAAAPASAAARLKTRLGAVWRRWRGPGATGGPGTPAT